MDIKRKQPLHTQKKEEFVFPEVSFPSKESEILFPKGPYQLGEEQLWNQPEVFEEASQGVPVQVVQTPSLQKKERRPLFHYKRMPFILKRAGFILGAVVLLLGGYGFFMQKSIESEIALGFQTAETGIDALGEKNFLEAKKSFLEAEAHFKTAKLQTLYFPTWLAKPLTLIPGISRFGSGVLALDASAHLTRGALEATTVFETISQSRMHVEGGKAVSYLDILEELKTPLQRIRKELVQADNSLQAVALRDVPEENKHLTSLFQQGIPGVVRGIDSLLVNTPLIEELLGKNGPRIYLFLFQNNQELRPTGGFIGTYGILEFKDGHARRFFIDGIFNPDGQLRENVVPPKPIQKISAGWSLHDSNWFPDFPTSAEKAIYFYEKTGGPTVDGVFTLTPSVMEELLSVTGPIHLPEYEMVVDAKNFIPTIQEQVEIKYDREENRPKKVLADLASILMEKVFAVTDPLILYQIADILVMGMNEKQILLYTRNPQTQEVIEKTGWSGRIEPSTHDYLSVVHTNINGYKTDGVIDDKVEHHVAVQPDGTLIATTKVIRKHMGGNTPYDWWNRVNSNYMRIYVPLGSQLIQATGHTQEFPKEPLDYEALEFTKDPTVTIEEEAITVDEKTGTRIGKEFDKTVFGNWVYVSPGEEVRVEYTYLLPFRIDPNIPETSAYAFLFQKQPGMEEMKLESSIEYPKGWNVYWRSDDQLLQVKESGIQLKRTLRSDAFWGVVFRK